MINDLLDVYIDESGFDAESPLVSVAAIAGLRSEWNKFTVEWQSVLSDAGVAICHATDSASKPLLARMVASLWRRSFESVGVAVDQVMYRRIASDDCKAVYGNAYGFCMRMCLRYLHQARKLDSMSLIVEHGQPNLDHLLGDFNRLAARQLGGIQSARRGWKKSDIPLQAADFLAHAVAKRDWQSIRPLIQINVVRRFEASEKRILRENELAAAEMANRRRHSYHLKSLRKRLKKEDIPLAFVAEDLRAKHKFPGGPVSWTRAQTSFGTSVIIPPNEDGRRYLAQFELDEARRALGAGIRKSVVPPEE